MLPLCKTTGTQFIRFAPRQAMCPKIKIEYTEQHKHANNEQRTDKATRWWVPLTYSSCRLLIYNLYSWYVWMYGLAFHTYYPAPHHLVLDSFRELAQHSPLNLRHAGNKPHWTTFHIDLGYAADCDQVLIQNRGALAISLNRWNFNKTSQFHSNLDFDI